MLNLLISLLLPDDYEELYKWIRLYRVTAVGDISAGGFVAVLERQPRRRRLIARGQKPTVAHGTVEQASRLQLDATSFIFGTLISTMLTVIGLVKVGWR